MLLKLLAGPRAGETRNVDYPTGKAMLASGVAELVQEQSSLAPAPPPAEPEKRRGPGRPPLKR